MIFLFLLILMSQILLSQDGVFVKKIVILGNEKTKSEIILRELTFGVGSQLDSLQISYNENRVYGIGLFNRVKIWYEKDSGDSATVFIWVNERWYIWPFPVLGWKDRDIRKFYLGAGLYHSNFRGRNEKLSASFAVGYDPWFEVEYLNPWILGTKEFFYSAEVFFQRVRNRSVILEKVVGEFYERHYYFTFTFGKRFGLYRKLWFLSGFRIVDVTGDLPAMKTVSSEGRDRGIISGFGFKYDTRDIPVYPNQGSLIFFEIRFYKILGATNFFQTGLHFQKFLKITLSQDYYLTLASRSLLLNSFGIKIPSYAHFYFGYKERIRGYFNDIFEGENLFESNLELRFPILKQRFFKIDWIPVEEFSVLKFGVDFAIFGDIGRVWMKGERISQLTFLKGYGAGLNFILPYDLILRLEYAFNSMGRGQFIVDFQASFD